MRRQAPRGRIQVTTGERRWGEQGESGNWLGLSPERARLIGLMVAALSLASSLFLLVRHDVLVGPGDHINYYKQASHLFPFVDNYYGPGYFVTIRVLHDAFQLDWFTAGKLTSWLSAWAFLILCWLLFARILGSPTSWYPLVLVAMNPTFITQSYAADAMMNAAAWSIAAITAAAYAPIGKTRWWLVPGLIFGIACLTRFQAFGLVIGALAGLLVDPSGRVITRMKCASLLLVGAVLPVLVWHALLLETQGYVPPNYNFVHLTLALGQFRTFWEVSDLTAQYGGLWGVLSSSETAPLQIAAFALKEAVKFPFGVGFRLVFVGAGWLVPGTVALLSARRVAHKPWFGAFALGLLLTGIGARGWTRYYVSFLPFLAIAIVFAIRAVSDSGRTALATMSWWLIVVTTVVWSPFAVREAFLASNWTEFAEARRHLEALRDPTMLVSSTAGGFPYGTTLRFVDQRDIMHPADTDRLVQKLRDAKVTHLIATERHTLSSFPDLGYLLDDSTANDPAGLQRELLIVSPKRLEIYRVLPR